MTKTSTVYDLFFSSTRTSDVTPAEGVHADLVGVHVNFGDVDDLRVEAVDRCDPVFELHDLGELFDKSQVALRLVHVNERIVVDRQRSRLRRRLRPFGQQS